MENLLCTVYTQKSTLYKIYFVLPLKSLKVKLSHHRSWLPLLANTTIHWTPIVLLVREGELGLSDMPVEHTIHFIKAFKLLPQIQRVLHCLAHCFQLCGNIIFRSRGYSWGWWCHFSNCLLACQIDEFNHFFLQLFFTAVLRSVLHFRLLSISQFPVRTIINHLTFLGSICSCSTVIYNTFSTLYTMN